MKEFRQSIGLLLIIIAVAIIVFVVLDHLHLIGPSKGR